MGAGQGGAAARHACNGPRATKVPLRPGEHGGWQRRADLRRPQRRAQRARRTDRALAPTSRKTCSSPMSSPARAPSPALAAARRPGGASSFDRALVLGVRDYVQQVPTEVGDHPGCPGGIDSALVAVIAKEALGAENVWGISMPSRYSSSHSRDDAAQLAPRNSAFASTRCRSTSRCAKSKPVSSLGFSRDGLPRNLTEEKSAIADARAPAHGALEQIRPARPHDRQPESELAVGYCTLYGDMCGALAVIADVLKTEIYDPRAGSTAGGEIIPANARSRSRRAPERAPEKPEGRGQPAALRCSRPHSARLRRRRGRFRRAACRREFRKAPCVTCSIKIVSSEYKRRQAAPGLKVSARAFGMGRRVPIAQGFRS